MLVKTKEKSMTIFKDIEVGQVFRDNDSGIICMKVDLEDDYICCPRCDEEININDEKGKAIYAVELETGMIFAFENLEQVEIIQGAFVED